MTQTHSESTFAVKSWDEKTWDGRGWKEAEGEKLTHAQIVNSYEGALQGESQLHYLMHYRADGFVHTTGLEHFVGSLDGKSGSFVLQHSGIVEDGVVKGRWQVLAGSGTGELVGLSGDGSSQLGEHQDRYPFMLDYAIE